MLLSKPRIPKSHTAYGYHLFVITHSLILLHLKNLDLMQHCAACITSHASGSITWTGAISGFGERTKYSKVLILSIEALPCCPQTQTIFNSLGPISTAEKLTVMHFFSKKVPHYALASTFVALGGILNGYVLKATILSLDRFRPLSLNLVSKPISFDVLEKAAFSNLPTRNDSIMASTNDVFTYHV